MTHQLHEHQVEVLRQIGSAPHLFCFLDYDGTLSPIAPTPAEAVPLPGTVELLEELIQAPRTAVALVTGRSVADVRSFVDVGGLYYVGIHGLEVQRPGQPVQMSPTAAAIRPLMPGIRRQLEESIGRRPGVFLEDKGVALACHYRLAARDDATAARAAVVKLVREQQGRGSALTFIDGHEVTEIRPAGANKGEAVSGLLAACQAPLLALYIGDDRTDEEAFQRLPADAITIRVGAPQEGTLARYLVADPEEVRAFLLEVLAARSC